MFFVLCCYDVYVDAYIKDVSTCENLSIGKFSCFLALSVASCKLNRNESVI